MILRTLGRVLLVPIAFALAAVTSGLVAGLLGLEKITAAISGKEGGVETIEAYFELFARGSALLAGLTILPALALVIIGEVARIRSWLYYMAGGGLALGILPLIARAGSAAGLTDLPPTALWQVLATSGFAGGLVYWLIAGRTA